MPTSALCEFQKFLDGITNRMGDVYRWKMYPDRACQSEEVNKHTVQTLMLAVILYELERKFGDVSAIDPAHLFAGAGLHDTGEGFSGDVRWDLKQHPIVGPLIEAMERDFFVREVVGALPEEIRERFLAYYKLQDEREDPTGRFFNAVEHVGYIIRAVDEFHRGSRKLAVDVIVKQRATIERYADAYASVRMVYAEFKDLVAEVCASPEGQQVAADWEQKREQQRALHPEDVRALLAEIPERVRGPMLAALQELEAKK